ncbi:MAG: FecR domain-containing protein [Deltaproteobacteria bacterium]|nr:FecR domain-containing protein [Deltaproteobacteria bacterium]
MKILFLKDAHRAHRFIFAAAPPIIFAVIAALQSMPVTAAKNSDTTVLSLALGDVQKRSKAGGNFNKAATGTIFYEGDRLRTGLASRAELKLADGSVLRLFEKSEVVVRTARFKNSQRQRFSAKLTLGRLWAAVIGAVGNKKGTGAFEISTPNAVCGVRGTRFNTEIDNNGTTTVKVYNGRVLISNRPIYARSGATKNNRVQVPGPQEVSRKQWEEMVADAMQQVTIAANGKMSAPQAFTASGDDWESWNEARDRDSGFKE